MISALAALILQAAAPVPSPPPPPPPPPPGRTEPARARANLASLFSDDDYPPEALRNHEKGTVGFRLLVGKDGMVAGCTITSSSRSASLDSTTCRLLTERARFTPAHDRRGRPVTDHVAGRITWRLDDRMHRPTLEATLLVATMRVTPTGESTCSIVLNNKPQTVHGCPAPDPLMIKAARSSGRTAEQTIVSITTPGGETEPVAAGDHGTQVLESEILLSIASDGSVVECRVIRNESRGPAAGGVPADPCRRYGPGMQAFEPPSGTAAPPSGSRSVSMKNRVYIRFLSSAALPTT